MSRSEAVFQVFNGGKTGKTEIFKGLIFAGATVFTLVGCATHSADTVASSQSHHGPPPPDSSAWSLISVPVGNHSGKDWTPASRSGDGKPADFRAVSA